MTKECECGCGQPVKYGNMFIRFHHLRIHNRDPKFRDYLSNLQRERLKDPRNHPFFGKHLSEETKRKISLAHTGKKMSEEFRKKRSGYMRELCHKHPEKNPAYGKPAWNKGLTKETDERVASCARKVKEAHKLGRMKNAYTMISNSLKGRLIGKENPNWRGGYEPYYGPDWRAQRRKALERDHHICPICGAPENGREHDVHHIIPFRVFGLEKYKEANRLDNLTTLCPSCHKLMKEVNQLSGVKDWLQLMRAQRFPRKLHLRPSCSCLSPS